MSYPGDSSLSDDIKERILTTFDQALDLTDGGSRKEALLGCDFVLRLDPLFEPARVLHKRLRADEDDIQTQDLRALMNGDAAAALDLDAIDSAAEGLEAADAPPGAPVDEPPVEEPPTERPPVEEPPVETPSIEEPPAEEPPVEVTSAGSLTEELDIEPETASFREAVEEALEAPGSALAETDSDLMTTFANERVDEPDPQIETSGAEPPDDPAPASVGGDTVATKASDLLADDEVDAAEADDGPGAAPQLDDESQRRIAELLDEGQDSYDAGEYQSAIDAWSRVFLIDIDHTEANRRIEQARRMAAEAERQVEEVFHEAMSHLDSGDLEQARSALERVLDLQPGHLAAQEYMERIDSGEALPSDPVPVESEEPAPAGFDLDEDYDEEGDEDLFATPDMAPSTSELEVPAEMPPAPLPARKRPRQTFVVVGSAVLLLVVVGGWFLIDSWDSLFPNSESVQAPAAPQRIDPIARAKKLHEQGKTAIAIAQLRRLPPGDPHYAEAQSLVAQWEIAEPTAEPEGPSAEELTRQREILDRAGRAYAAKEYLLTSELLERAAAIAPLGAEAAAMRADVESALEPLREQIQVFKSGDWEYALPTLWRMREADITNPDVNRLIVDSYYNLGVRDLQRGRPEAAVRKFEEALNLRSDDPTLRRLISFSRTYETRNEDLLYRIFVKYLPFR